MNEEYERYYDGVPPEVSEKHSKMTLEEIEAEINEEKKKCDEMKEW